MATNRFGRAILALAVWATLVAAPAFAQEKVKPAVQAAEDKKLPVADHTRYGNLVTAGYATPGSPMSAKIKAIDGNILGGTVYYAVFRRTGRAGDTWGVRANFDSSFVEGENIRRAVSPHLDTEAEYLYLYQVVNDRAIHDPMFNKPKGEIPAVVDEQDKYTKDIASFSLRLVVDPRHITSWGYFSDTGFALRVAKENQPNVPVIMAVSSHPSIGDVLPPKNYRPWAPSKRLDTRSGFGVSSDTEGLNENQGLLKQRVKGVRFVNFGEVTKQGGLKPDFVQILVLDTPLPLIDADRAYADEPARAIFRVDWQKVPVPEAEHSVVFGFTTDLPPINQPIRIKDPEASAVVAAVAADADREFRPVADDEADATGVAPAVGVAAGAAAIPSPRVGGEAAVAAPGGGVLSPAFGGGATGFPGGGGGGLPLGGAIGTLGAARPTSSGGGGGLGGGRGDTGGEQVQSQVPTITNTNNNILTNQQWQAQLQAQIQAQIQAQLQKQSQSNDNRNGGDCDVIPEPATMVLGLLSLPGLWFYYRRRNAAALPAA